MSDQRLDYLFFRHMAKKTSVSEQEELFILLSKPENEQQANELTNAAWENFKPQNPVFEPDQSAQILKKVLSAGQTEPSIQRRFFTRTRLSAAAALLLLVAGVYMFTKTAKQAPRQSAQSAKTTTTHDIDPGHNGAVLTLSNGSQIVLDSSQNGNLTRQGGVQVVKQNGQLTYDAAAGNSEVVYNTMSTPKGRQYQLVLSDGTKVWLNAASSIKFPTAFTGRERVVEISGEAYLEVASNAGQPFVVHVVSSSPARDCQLQVLGTAFNVNAYDDEDGTRTTLLEGSLKVKGGQTETLLTPGLQSRLLNNGNMTVLKDENLDAVLAWKNGFFTFDNTGIKTVMNQLTRWYGIEVEYKDGIIPQDNFWGDIPRNEKLSTVLNVLSKSGVKFAIEGQKVVVLK